MNHFARAVKVLGRSGMKFELTRMNAAMDAFGRPQDRYPTVHVAGTNGKGSVCALLASALRECGYRTGLYTSPHLERYNERFRINGVEISGAALDRLSSRLSSMLSARKLAFTQFEFLTALAFLWFADQKVDVAVIEVGLGGRLDATNVVGRGLAQVITNIELDHTDWLGTTRSRIAAEKAGIIKPRVPVITGASGAALEVIRRRAAALSAPLHVVRFDDPAPPAPSFVGRHQHHNAAIALRTVAVLRDGLSLPSAAVAKGFRRARWPGRFERVSAGRRTVILDGAHNPAAMSALTAALEREVRGPVDLLFGALLDKDYRAMASRLAPLVRRGIAVTVASERAQRAERLAGLPAWRGKMRPAPDLDAALSDLLSRDSSVPLVVTGSLYLVGAVRSRIRHFIQ